FDVALGEGDEGKIGGGAPAGVGVRRVMHQRLQGGKPAARQVFHLLGAHQRRGKAPACLQGRPLRGVQRQRIDLQGVRQRRRRVPRLPKLANPLVRRPPLRRPRRREPPQIV